MEPAPFVLNDYNSLCGILGPDLAKQVGNHSSTDLEKANNEEWCPRAPRHGPDKQKESRHVYLNQETDYDTLLKRHRANLASQSGIRVYVGHCGASLSLLPLVKELDLCVVGADETPEKHGDAAAQHFERLFGVKVQRCGNEHAVIPSGVDLCWLSPPCQTQSRQNKSSNIECVGYEFDHSLDAIAKMPLAERPATFLLETVDNLLGTRQLLRLVQRAKTLGYAYSFKISDNLKLGGVSNRKRLIIAGSLKHNVDSKLVDDFANKFMQTKREKHVKRSVSEVIDDVEDRPAEFIREFHEYVSSGVIQQPGYDGPMYKYK